MTDFFIIGPIERNDSFLIISEIDNKPAILTGKKVNEKFEYYWDNNLTIEALQELKIIVFTGNGTTPKLTYQDTINGGSLGSVEGILSNVALSQEIDTEQSQFATWFQPTILLTGGEYTFENVSIYKDSSITTTVKAEKLQFLPLAWYGRENDGSCVIPNRPVTTIINWICNEPNPPAACEQQQIFNQAWTRLSECNENLRYQYCPSGKICGNDNCNGPCTAIYYDCNYDTGNSQFVCDFDPEKFFTDTKWYENPYVIGFVIGIIVIVIILVVILIIVGNSFKKKKYKEYMASRGVYS